MAGQGKQFQNKPQITWAQTFRDITIASMNRGQLPVLGCIGLFGCIIWKMPNKDVSKLVFDLVDRLSHGELIAYVLLIVVSVGWFIHAKIMRTNFSEEYKRIGKEKSKLQSRMAGVNFESSDK